LNIGRHVRALRLVALPLLAVAGVAAFLLMRPRAASETVPVEAPAEAITAAATPPQEATPAAEPAHAPAAASPDVMAQALAAWRDPFQAEAVELVVMEERIKLKQKEIEVLKLTLEEKKLRDQLRGTDLDTTRTRPRTTPATAPAPAKRVTVKALLCSEARRAALLTNGGTSAWVSEGESFGGMQVVHLDPDKVTFMTADGRRVVISMQR